MSMKKYIVSNPDIMGGDPVIKGTRIPIDVILHRMKDGYSMDEIHKMYPTPSLKTLKGAIGEAIDILSQLTNAERFL